MIEELLVRQMVEDGYLSSVLAQYGGEPAVFYQKAPMDEDVNWSGSSFPRLQFNLDFSFDPERKQAGTLTVDIWACTVNETEDGGNLDRAIAQRLEEIISGVFYTPKTGNTLCAVWENSVAYMRKAADLNSEISPVETYGIAVTFDLIAFPTQDSFQPDPISALQSFAKEVFPSWKVIGLEELPEIWKPRDSEPALYWRMAGAEMTREIFSCTWYLGQFFGHISCETVEARNRCARGILEVLRGRQDLLLEDGSFLRLTKSKFHHDGNPLSQGQIALWGEFGVLASRYVDLCEDEILNHGYLN
ncbi:MAG: hypothetical protein R3Y63_04145 [Eubacteriales bacterium]